MIIDHDSRIQMPVSPFSPKKLIYPEEEEYTNTLEAVAIILLAKSCGYVRFGLNIFPYQFYRNISCHEACEAHLSLNRSL